MWPPWDSKWAKALREASRCPGEPRAEARPKIFPTFFFQKTKFLMTPPLLLRNNDFLKETLSSIS